MKHSALGVILAVGLAVPLHAETDTFQPEPGVRCDRAQQVCTDAKGPSFGWTRVQFGDGAALELVERADLAVNLDASLFRLENNGLCDMSIKVCYQNLEPDAELTVEHFGPAAAEELQRRRQRIEQAETDLFYLYPRLACDRRARICYTPRGPSIALTRFTFGNAATLRLLRRQMREQRGR
ncbi:MAG: YcgJ family protein [Candidatus Competibacterales bacterium]|nr:YcgJ family protein [Candidatus Competibacterales bacterium]